MLSVLAQADGIGRQERTAAHAGIDIAVFVLLHDLGGDVIRHHALCRALCRKLGQAVVSGAGENIILIQYIDQFGEGRCDPDALLVFDTLHALDHDLFDQHGQIVAGAACGDLIQVHVHGDKRSLAVAGHQGDQLILDGLDTALDLLRQAELDDLVDDLVDHRLTAGLPLFRHLFADLPAADVDKGSQMRQREGLAAVLVGGDLGDDLCRHIAGSVETMGLFNQSLADDSAVLQHILKVDEVAVVLLLGIIIGIMEVDDTLFVCFYHIGGKKDAAGQIFGHFACHIVALGRIDDRILVGVFLFDLLVDLLDQGKDPVVGRIGLAGQLAAETIADIFLCHLIAAHLHDAGLDHILDILDIYGMRGFLHLSRDFLRDRNDLILVELVDGLHFFIGLTDRIDDLGKVKCNLLPVSFDNVRCDHNTCIICHIFFPSC